MINVTCQNSCRAIVFEFVGRITLSDEPHVMAQLEKILPEQCQGFTILTDLTAVESWEANMQQAIKRVMDYLNQRGVSKIIRVIPDQQKDIGFNIMSIFHYSPEVQVMTVPTREEALARLKTGQGSTL